MSHQHSTTRVSAIQSGRQSDRAPTFTASVSVSFLCVHTCKSIKKQRVERLLPAEMTKEKSISRHCRDDSSFRCWRHANQDTHTKKRSHCRLFLVSSAVGTDFYRPRNVQQTTRRSNRRSNRRGSIKVEGFSLSSSSALLCRGFVRIPFCLCDCLFLLKKSFKKKNKTKIMAD